MKILLSTLFTLLWSMNAEAHVKWFSEHSDLTEPVLWDSLFHPHVFMIGLFAMAMVFAAEYISSYFGNNYIKPLDRLTQLPTQNLKNLFISVIVVVMMLLNYDAGVILTPETSSDSDLIRYIQVSAVILSVLPSLRSSALAAGLISLFALSAAQYGIVYMLDYLHVLGLAGFLIFTDPHARYTNYHKAMSVLYLLTGFSLCWLGIEKMVFPSWAHEVLEQQPALAMGFAEDFFIRGSAFVEFSFGFMFMAQRWNRLLAIVLFMVMVATATFFGSVEVKGHLAMHAILLVFIFDGRQRLPLQSFKQSLQNGAALSAFFCMTLAFITWTYHETAQWSYENNAFGIVASKAGAVATLITLGFIAYFGLVTRSLRKQQKQLAATEVSSITQTS